jgi:DNA polymerase-3 subunit delta'
MWRLIGQERAVGLLRRGLEKGNIAHAYLVTGPAHSGKMTLALELARALNCLQEEFPCGECISCQKIDQAKHADVQVISLADDKEDNNQKEIGIEQVRQLQHSANLPPFEGKYKVFIIEDAELLSTEAANCLLKTLEEPQSKVVFVLLAGEGQPILGTIASRCQQIKMAPMPAAEIEAAIIERWGVEVDKARLLSRLCCGRIGWAVTAIENDELLQTHYQVRQGIVDLMFVGGEARFAHAEQMALRFGKQRSVVYDELDLWLELWRDMLLVKAGLSQAVINIDIQNELNQWTDAFNLGEIRQFIDVIQQTVERLQANANSRLALEVMLLDMPTGKRQKIAGGL